MYTYIITHLQLKSKRSTTAQKLLEKAKRGHPSKKSSGDAKLPKDKKVKAAGSSTKEEVQNSPAKPSERRRSSRLSDKQKSMEEVLIVDDDSVDSCYTPAKSKANKGKKAKGTPKAETPNKETKCENFSSCSYTIEIHNAFV